MGSYWDHVPGSKLENYWAPKVDYKRGFQMKSKLDSKPLFSKWHTT